MQGMTIIEAFSLLSSFASLILAVVAIIAAKSSEKEVRENFQKTQELMNQFEMRTKETLAEVDKKSAVIERTVSESQQKLMDTLTNILNETIIPKKEDMGEKMGMQIIEQMMSNPEQGMQNLTGLADLAQLAERFKD
jgi:hypothetical protein